MVEGVAESDLEPADFVISKRYDAPVDVIEPLSEVRRRLIRSESLLAKVSSRLVYVVTSAHDQVS